MGQLFTGSVAIRGIRGPIPSGYILGRVDSGSGPPQLVSMAALGSKMVQSGIPVTRLSALQDVAFGTLTSKQHLEYDATAAKWVNVAAPALSNLTDADTTGVANNNLLKFDSGTSKWKPWALSYTLAGASDVLITALSDTQMLAYSAAAGKWVNVPAPTGGGGGGSTTLGALTDVGLTALSAKQALTYDTGTSKWINSTLNLSFLSDVAITTPANNDLLTFDLVTGLWKNKPNAASFTLAGDTDVAIATPAAGDMLRYNAVSGKWENFVNKIWSWPCPSLGSTQNTATASKGSPIYLTRAIIVDKIAIAINATSGIVYSGYIATITAGSGNSATITGLVAATARITCSSTKYQTFEFDLTPTTLAANTLYMLCGVGTTLATATTNLGFGVSSGGTYPELPLDNAVIVNQWSLIGTGCAIFALPTLSDNPVALNSTGASSNNLYIGLRWRYA